MVRCTKINAPMIPAMAAMRKIRPTIQSGPRLISSGKLGAFQIFVKEDEDRPITFDLIFTFGEAVAFVGKDHVFHNAAFFLDGGDHVV